MRRAAAACAVGLLLAGAFALGFFITRGPQAAENRDLQVAPLTSKPVPPNLSVPIGVRVQNEVRTLLHQSYFRTVGPEVLSQETVDGMISALGDPYTEYLPRRNMLGFGTERATATRELV